MKRGLVRVFCSYKLDADTPTMLVRISLFVLLANNLVEQQSVYFTQQSYQQ